ncbi:deoxyribonuclease [Halovenus sp. WSH3]|uniref:Deoxyribonuclease n=1 Tax=Halovenus carboxidivorans TaxID=2692199 RepID=A0A6B0T0E7_9EURY|nr:TatD family hydrolase [Halovenus carboxidivorans]MXR51474.1 deoxyribonuclease [Halovenus carboxidivorans]
MNTDLDTPILDNHLHLDPVNGDGADHAEDFANAGGTHLLVLNKPSWYLVDDVEDTDAFRETFEITCEVTAEASERLPGRAWPVLGVHPGLISRLVEDGYTPDEAREFMQSGLDIAAEFVADGPALAIKSGRPHYDVSEAVWDASNDVMKHAFELGAEVGCAVQLHTEGGEDFREIAEWAEDRGLPREQVVKHYSGGYVDGPIPSIISNKDALEAGAEHGDSFLMETDFLDDPERPGAVLGPKTVPKRVRWLLENGYEEAVHRAHVETPARVYGIDTEATLSE